MGKDIRLRITAAENGGVVIYPIPEAPAPNKVGALWAAPPLYIVPKVDPTMLGETILSIMATMSLVPEDVDVDDISF